MHMRKEPEAHCVQKGRLSCDSYAPHVESARSDWTRVVKVNRRKTRPYRIPIRDLKLPSISTTLTFGVLGPTGQVS